MSASCLEPDGSSSGIRLYIQLWYGAVRYGTVRCGAVRYSTVRCSTVRYGVVRYGTVRGMVRCTCISIGSRWKGVFDTVSNTHFYLLTAYVRYRYRYCIEHTLLPSDCLCVRYRYRYCIEHTLLPSDRLCSIPVSILYRIHTSTF